MTFRALTANDSIWSLQGMAFLISFTLMRKRTNPQIPKDVPKGYFQFTHQRVAANAARAGTAGIIQSALREAEKPNTKKFSKTNQTKSAAQS